MCVLRRVNSFCSFLGLAHSGHLKQIPARKAEFPGANWRRMMLIWLTGEIGELPESSPQAENGLRADLLRSHCPFVGRSPQEGTFNCKTAVLCSGPGLSHFPHDLPGGGGVLIWGEGHSPWTAKHLPRASPFTPEYGLLAILSLVHSESPRLGRGSTCPVAIRLKKPCSFCYTCIPADGQL